MENIEKIECPACKNTEIDTTDNFCEMCGHDLRPSHIVRPCCGFSSISTPKACCPMCGVKTAE